MASVYRIKGAGGVIIESTTFLELPKAQQKTTTGVIREGMFRYNVGWEAFEGALKFQDGSIEYRRFANLDENGRLLTSQLPDSITSGLKYTGSYDPLTDDIDPPFTYTSLPAPNANISGDYYIVRGIIDQAAIHLNTHPTTNPFVIFTPANPMGTGDWMEIKYYVDGGVVNSAFARFKIANIPPSHVGLLSLANSSTDLTNAFSTFNDPSIETGISDSDWVILTSVDIQRLRQSRVSMLAASVSFDTNIMRDVEREFVSNSSNAQGVIDNLIIYGLRRTGDSMTDDGTEGSGRFGITYGSVTEPSIAFNDGTSDPDLNDGMHPSKWTDTKTGIYHPGNGMIGFTSTGVEKFRINSTGVILYEAANVNPATNPAFQFQGSGNTANPGISALSDIITLSIKSKAQVEFKDALTLMHGSLTVDKDLSVGGNSTVTGNSTVNGSETVKGNVILGTNTSNTLLVNGVSTFQGNSTFNGASNRLKNINIMPNGVFTLENATSQSTIAQLDGDLKINLTNFADITIYDGATIRTRFNRYGVQLPIINPIDDAVGVDGMIAYSTVKNTVMQKSNGKWTTVSGGGEEHKFLKANWVLDGVNYKFTIVGDNIQSVQVQESVGANYSPVEVDNVLLEPTQVTIFIPSTPDFRFDGRVIVTYG